ncbi:MAG: type III polyketide synthase [Bacteroidia bacterium]
MSYLHAIQTAVPKYKTSQEEISVFMQNWYDAGDEVSRKIQLMYARSGIQFRHSCLSDFSGHSERPFFSDLKFPGIEERMGIYFQTAPEIALEACMKTINESGLGMQDITHLITISCTGMAAPGLDLILLEKLNLSQEVQRTSVNFMGCYAGFHAMKMARQITQSEKHAHVLLLSVELCTLHFQREYSLDQVAANLLFSDGAAACLVSSDKPIDLPSLSLSSFYSRVIPKGVDDMAWNISESGFLMKLSAYIPDLLKEGMGDILQQALLKSGKRIEDIYHWAIHPGGKKILDQLKLELQLNDEQLKPSYTTLNDYGNMSSATIFYVLKLMLNNKDNWFKPGFAAGFGPGLTVETMNFNN